MGKEINILEFVRPSKLKTWLTPKPGSPPVERYCDRIPDVCLREISPLPPIARWGFIVIWRLYCLNKKRSPVKLTLKVRREFNIHRNTLRDVLRVLEKAGIISIAMEGHEALLITVLIPRKKKGA
jgi:hypothetical protein